MVLKLFKKAVTLEYSLNKKESFEQKGTLGC